MRLLDHMSVGVPNIAEARKFYDPILNTIDCQCLDAGDDYAVYGHDKIEFLLLLPFNGEAATGGNGTHVGFAAATQDAVNNFHEVGLGLGGQDEGKPGIRGDYPFPDVYAAYIRDPYGNKLEVVHNGFSIDR